MIPKNFIFDMFGRSPVKPLQMHIGKVLSCTRELPAFFDAVLREDWETAELQQQRIVTLEHEADSLKKDLRLSLPKGMMLAMSRRDVLEVLTMQDRIANTAKDIAGLVLGRRMHFPPEVASELGRYVGRCIDAVAQADRAVNELDELVETGFRGREVNIVFGMLDELDKVEHDTDTLQRQIRARLFVLESSLPPVDVMFMYRIIDWIGDLADLAQRVGSRLMLMLAR
jgi:uncharacterized protein